MSQIKIEYPMDPRLKQNPLSNWKKADWKSVHLMRFIDEFHKKYKIEGLLNERYHNIYLLKDKELNAYVVGKRYDFDEEDPNAFDIAYREWVFVVHTMLIEYLEYFYWDRIENQAWIIMNNYGDTLHQRIIKNEITNNEHKAKEIAWDLLDKLWIIHNCGFVYGDVKPSNIVKREFDPNIKGLHTNITNGWKFIDFGLIQKINARKGYIGTFGWTAPEIKYNSLWNKYKPSSDIFSFGLLILYVLCGRQPFQEDPKIRRDFFLKLGAKMDDDESWTSDKLHKWKIHWYKSVILQSENAIKNKLVKLYFDNKISMDLFELLHDGILVYDPKKRWNCKKIYYCNWFKDFRD